MTQYIWKLEVYDKDEETLITDLWFFTWDRAKRWAEGYFGDEVTWKRSLNGKYYGSDAENRYYVIHRPGGVING